MSTPTAAAIAFDVHYERGHKYVERWAHDEKLYCPACGKQAVWMDTGGGDYDVGPGFICVECRATFYMPSLTRHEDLDWAKAKANCRQDRQRLAVLRTVAGIEHDERYVDVVDEMPNALRVGKKLP